MGKKGDIGDWEDMAKKWLKLVYDLIEKPEKKEFERAMKLVVETRKLLDECEFPLHQALVNDMRMQLATVVNNTKYVLENVPKGNYYIVMPDFVTHLTRLVLLIAKAIQNVWSAKNGIAYEYVPPEASVYLPASQEGFFRPGVTSTPAAPSPAPTPTAAPMVTAAPTPMSAYTAPIQPPPYPPQYYYSKAYKYAYWTPRSSAGRRLAALSLLTFLPMFLSFLRYKAARGGISPQDVSLLKSLIDKFNVLSRGVSIPGVDLSSVQSALANVANTLRSTDISGLQASLMSAIDNLQRTINPLAKQAESWLKENIPKVVEEVRSLASSGRLPPVELNDVMISLRNVSNLVGDQIKEIPGIVQSGVQQLIEVARAAAPAVTHVGREVAEGVRRAVSGIGLGGISLPSPDQIDFEKMTKTAADFLKAADNVIKQATENIGKLLKDFLGF
ncbi:MAG: hypothetical protein ACTSXJ_11415 [Candidatus Baldrarchaeia archaeon]